MHKQTCTSCGYVMEAHAAMRSFSGKFCPQCGARMTAVSAREEMLASACVARMGERFREFLREPTRHNLSLKIACVACATLVVQGALGFLYTSITVTETAGATPLEAAVMEALSAQSAGDMEQARIRFFAITQEFPESPRGYAGLGFVAKSVGDVASARQYFEMALVRDPHHAASHQNLGVLDRAAGNTASARAHFAAVLEVEPDNATVQRLFADLN